MAASNSPQKGIYTDQITTGRNTTMHFDEAAHLDLASGRVTLPGSLGRGHVNLAAAMFGGRNAASDETVASGSSAPTAFWGGLLMPDGVPAMKYVSTADKTWMLDWASAGVATVAMLPISIPQDLATAGGLTVEFYGETYGTASATDAKDCLTIGADWAIGGTSDTPTTAPDFTSTPSWKGITIASGSITSDSVTLRIFPAAHALRGIRVYNARMSYQKKTS